VERTPKEDLEALILPHLKEILRTREQKVGGSKKELVERILALDWDSSAQDVMAYQQVSARKSQPGMSEDSVGDDESDTTVMSGQGVWELPFGEVSGAHLAVMAIRSLYRRCMRSAQRCPDAKWRATMHSYVHLRFRGDVPSNNFAPGLVAGGEYELQQMDMYHTAREEKQKIESRREGRTLA